MDIFMSGEVDAKIGDEYRELRKEIEKKLKQLQANSYGEEVGNIAIIPIIVNLKPDLENAGFFKEKKQFSKKSKEADFRLRINYDKFVNSNLNTKRLLIIKNVIESIRFLGTKAKVDFDANRLEVDILNLFVVEKGLVDSLEM
jgi:hypothetical protein